MSGLFCIENLLKVGRKKYFSNFMDFNPLKPKWSKIFHNKWQNKIVLVKMTLKLAKKPSGKEKILLKFVT